MITIAATIGFIIVALCTSMFFLDFALINLGKRPFFGLPQESAARWIAGWLFAGTFLMMLTFPDLIVGYKQCDTPRDSRGITITESQPEETTDIE